MKLYYKGHNKTAPGNFNQVPVFSQLFVKGFFFLSVLVLIFTSKGFPQSAKVSDEGKIRRFTREINKIYGVDDQLINGYPYTPPANAIQSHPYFGNTGWKMADVFMKGDSYKNQLIKYDLSTDAIILKAQLGENVTKLVHLNSLYVDSLKFGRHLFVHSRQFFPPDSLETFYEKVYMSETKDFGLLIHYSKTYLSQYTEIAPRGRFSDTDVNKWLFVNGNTEKVNRRRAFLKQFDRSKRGMIRNYFRQNDFRYNSATTNQLKGLMKFCYDQVIDKKL